jgi:hypothetical protein
VRQVSAGVLLALLVSANVSPAADSAIVRAAAAADGTAVRALVKQGADVNFSPLPIVLAGGASEVKGGRHLVFPKDTHMSNLLLAMLDKMGARIDTFGDSTGAVTI